MAVAALQPRLQMLAMQECLDAENRLHREERAILAAAALKLSHGGGSYRWSGIAST
jgi:transposase-like protein